MFGHPDNESGMDWAPQLLAYGAGQMSSHRAACDCGGPGNVGVFCGPFDLDRMHARLRERRSPEDQQLNTDLKYLESHQSLVETPEPAGSL